VEPQLSVDKDLLVGELERVDGERRTTAPSPVEMPPAKCFSGKGGKCNERSAVGLGGVAKPNGRRISEELPHANA
jgi:hypothetical protein